MNAESPLDPSYAAQNLESCEAAVPLYNNLALCLQRRRAWKACAPAALVAPPPARDSAKPSPVADGLAERNSEEGGLRQGRLFGPRGAPSSPRLNPARKTGAFGPQEGSGDRF